MKKIIIFLMLCILTTSCSKLNVFGFGEKKNKFEKLKINEYLWIASNNLLKNYTKVQTNLEEGSILTDWIILKKKPNVRFRIKIYILGSNLYEENIEILTEKEFNHNGVWKREKVSESFNINLKEKIVLNAKSLDLEK
jgi:hypothetical protein